MVADVCQVSLTTLLNRSAQLLHQSDGIDWKSIALEAASPPEAKAAPQSVEDSEEESEDDDDLFGMLGGYESSDDEQEVAATGDEAQVEGEIEEDFHLDDDEEDAALLKRAAAVHNALLLSLDPVSAAKGIDLTALVGSIVKKTGDLKSTDTTDELSNILAYILSPSTFEERPKSFRGSQEKWRKVCSTNALMAIQFLLHLLQSDVLTGWNRIILPLLLGKPDGTQVSLLMKNDVLREAVLNLTAPISPTDGVEEQVKNTCEMCIQSVKSAACSPNVTARLKMINVVCSVLIHLFDNTSKLTRGKSATNFHEKSIVRNAMHQSVVIILRGICYDVAEDEKAHPPLLSVEALRVITGMLLLKLYPPSNDTMAKFGANSDADERAIELWGELLMLLSPYSSEVIEMDGAKMRRCKNWNHTAPLSATAILCVVLPTFLSMELPTIGHDSNKRCRPALQSSIWNLLRTCLGRCDDSPNFSGSSRDGGDGGGRGSSLLSRENKSTDSSADIPTDQLLRRRSAHCVRILVEHERERLKQGSAEKGGKKNNNVGTHEDVECADAWMKYVLVFEMLEMEIELHLVDQVWPTLRELAARVSNYADAESSERTLNRLPELVWEDIASILKRVLLSEAPTLRKLGLYRLLKGDAGIHPTVPERGSEDDTDQDVDRKVFMNKPKSKWKIKKETGDLTNIQSAPLSVVSVPFVMDVVIVAYDSILQTKVGTNMQIDQDGTLKSESITPMLSDFLSNYAITLALTDGNDSQRLADYVKEVFGSNLIKGAKARSLVTFFHAVANALESITAASLPSPALEQDTVKETIRAMLAQFSSGGAPQTLQDALKCDLALALQHTKPWEKPDVNLVLQVLALYPPEERNDKQTSVQQNARIALNAWLQKLGNGEWVEAVAQACSSAFVMGDLVAFGGCDWLSGVNTGERETGMALSTLAFLKGNASEILWPAIFKGLQTSPSNDHTSPSFCKANRSMILLEFGCREKVLSGMGNGDLVADKNQSLLPPPPNVESILHNAVTFIMSQLTLVVASMVCAKGESTASGANRSSEANALSTLVASLIDQIAVLHQSYPSSVAIPLVGNTTLNKAVESMANGTSNMIESQILLYAALSCGAEFVNHESLQMINTCQTMLDGDFTNLISGSKARKDTKQALRSVFQYAKWGCLSLLIPIIAEQHSGHNANEQNSLCENVIKVARESVDATPVIALTPLFRSVVASGVYVTDKSQGADMLASLQTIIDTLFAIMDEENTSSNWVYMLHEICKLIFSPKLLRDEYQTLVGTSVNENKNRPILRAFEKLLKMAGTTKPHICKTAVSIISSAWLGEESSTESGILAIPYRDHIIDLLIYKEGKVDDSALHQSSYQDSVEGLLPKSTDSSSITRAFVLVFLSKLPPLESISDTVLVELVHYIIDGLLDIAYKGPAVGKPFITGSEEYARATRSWQALCLLKQYITDNKARQIAPKLFEAMQHNTHGTVRYFIEVFAIQCTRSHPDIFGTYFVREINRTDLSLQYVSSLMVIGGNVIVGKYSSAFFQNSGDQKIKDVLCGVIPWLSSTQGFSRAIAQLLVHKLIPLIVDVSSAVVYEDKTKDDAVLTSIYEFLENNGEMARLRSKQANFFDSYDVDGACSLEGLLSIPVDEGEEACPTHLVDAIKDCLVEVYAELHEEDAPLWKQMEDLSVNDKVTPPQKVQDKTEVHDEAELVNFQRKILPLDALDLSIQSMKDQKLFNAAGKKKQDLIICATLVDKVPNLAGLARTAEIFAASTLVMPNLLVRKQDDFKTISASANDWIEMEECKEDELLSWLYKKKSQGYTIVGLEQTSSSKCITKFKYPNKTVLLLGKEKEGIPVEFLSVVDQCIEIPQLGIIRSLNVHVTGAIAIWKYTEQMLCKSKSVKK